MELAVVAWTYALEAVARMALAAEVWMRRQKSQAQILPSEASSKNISSVTSLFLLPNDKQLSL